MITINRAIDIMKLQQSYCADINIDVIMAYKLAIESLSSQIGEYPVETYLSEIHRSYSCVCGADINIKIKHPKYCSECGQKLNWE